MNKYKITMQSGKEYRFETPLDLIYNYPIDIQSKDSSSVYKLSKYIVIQIKHIESIELISRDNI